MLRVGQDTDENTLGALRKPIHRTGGTELTHNYTQGHHLPQEGAVDKLQAQDLIKRFD